MRCGKYYGERVDLQLSSTDVDPSFRCIFILPYESKICMSLLEKTRIVCFEPPTGFRDQIISYYKDSGIVATVHDSLKTVKTGSAALSIGLGCTSKLFISSLRLALCAFAANNHGSILANCQSTFWSIGIGNGDCALSSITAYSERF
jgi:hypothetical protein